LKKLKNSSHLQRGGLSQALYAVNPTFDFTSAMFLSAIFAACAEPEEG
jgi:hypothetical protein